ncbi:MAG: phosphoribosylformylglycinamidine synthase subunit PurS [Acidobacteria bacterium]|nr:phosphoribosylformylglycinamidine synthase subunit PurS [Acidobacteriota bacterium]
MVFRVHVSLKATVLDPQGQTICSALRGQGHLLVAGVRQGKFFDIEVATGADQKRAQSEIEQIARDVLTNPVIEDCRVECLEQ